MLTLILRNLRYRKLRSLLTVLGIVIGTTLILALIFLSEGMKTAVAAQLQNFGSDLIFIFPGQEDNPFVGMVSGAELRDKDVNAVREVEGIRFVLPMQTANAIIEFEGEEKSNLIHGSPWRETRIIYEESQGFGLAEGVWPTRDDAKEVVLGFLAAKKRFNELVRVGDEITVHGRRFIVVGIFDETGDAVSDSAIYFSLNEFRRVSGNATGVGSVAAKISSGFDINVVASDIKSRLLRQRGIGDFVVLTSEKAIQIIGDILNVIQLVLTAIAAVALIVGGVGILNTMFTSVLERTREIGTLKALGATNRRILSMFLIESGAMGLFGGLVAMGIAIGLAKTAEFFAHRNGFELLKITIDPLFVIGILLFTFILGMIFGVVPAWQAARLRPTEALRYE